MFLFTQSIHVSRGAVDIRSGAWVEASSHDIPGCAVDWTASQEVTGTQDTVTVDATVYAPYGADVTATDRVSVGADVFNVVGQPAPWANPFTGWTPGTVIQLVHSKG